MEDFDELSEQEKIEQENFFLKAKLMINKGLLHESKDLDPYIENQFLQNIIDVENAERKPVYEVLGIDPKDFPPSDRLTEEELTGKLEELLDIMAEHGFVCDLSDKLPEALVYEHLIEEYLYEITDVLPEGWVTHIDGCTGDCPSCFQADYCRSCRDIWTHEELEEEL
ncbi:MAG: hypothetical protein KJ607_02245, partial [Bacteroidetes bacterium]|nr:hypothetical protein [Bacteroidota bacterium]